MIQSGKSEALLDWIQNKEAAGFLTPTICGRKMLYDVADRRYHPYELEKKAANSISIGKFIIDDRAFVLADVIVEENFEKEWDWIVIDEIGKLELQGCGHHLLFEKLLDHAMANILVVVRSELLREIISKYGLHEAPVISVADLQDLT